MKILVSGAGIAGLTVVECAETFRLTGTPIVIRGDAIEAVTEMGLQESVMKRRIRMSEENVFVASQGEPVATMPMALRGGAVQIL